MNSKNTINVYSLKDVKVGFTSPFTFQNDELAIRYVKNIVESGGSLVAMNPADFELWHVGTMNLDSGYIESDVVLFICSAASFVK